jgi:hypothetical protein
MVNNVIEVVNYVIAARPSLLNFLIADTLPSGHLRPAHNLLPFQPNGYNPALRWQQRVATLSWSKHLTASRLYRKIFAPRHERRSMGHGTKSRLRRSSYFSGGSMPPYPCHTVLATSSAAV